MKHSPPQPDPNPRLHSNRSLMKRIGDLPDLRWGKVLSARHKIGAGLYEHDETLDAMLPSLANEVGALLRREMPDPPE